MPRLPAFVRTRRGVVATVAVAALVIGGGVGAGVALADHSSSGPASAGASASPTPAATPSEQKNKGVHGKIVTASADKLTVREGNGTVVTVLITAKTHFGSKKRPAKLADLVPGVRVTVIGPLSGTTVSARRIVPAMAKGTAPTPSPASSAGTA